MSRRFEDSFDRFITITLTVAVLVFLCVFAYNFDLSPEVIKAAMP